MLTANWRLRYLAANGELYGRFIAASQ